MKKNNPSVYDRTALGHYPISAEETIKISGFNLGTSATVADEKSNTATLSNGELPLGALVSGKWSITVGGVKSINNINDNNANGMTVTKTSGGIKVKKPLKEATKAELPNYYNSKSNGDNNLLLTDDFVVDVWQFNKQAARPISGVISDPVMKINPKTNELGFAFTNGPLYFSMPGTVAEAEDKRNAAGFNSYAYWQGSYDFMSSVGFAYDSEGHTYGCAAGGDINETDADRFSFMTDRWGISGAATGGSYGGTNAIRLETIAQYGDSAGNGTGTLNFDKNRIKSPSIATSRGTNSTNIYMAYYDNLNEEIRFRYGNLGDTTKKGNLPKVWNLYAEFNDFWDDYTVNRVSTTNGNWNGGTYNYYHCNIPISGENDNSLGNAGEYLGIDVAKSASGNDVIVMCWYDSVAGSLMYTYNENPTATKKVTTNGIDTYLSVNQGRNKTNWHNATTVMEDVGEYCQIAVDKNGGIHIVAYDGNSGDLVYAYAPSYSGTFTTCIVDSYAIVGQNITLDVALNDSGVAVPYIGYYGLSSAKPKIAYLADPTAFYAGTQVDGASDDVYTGVWEVSLVPTTSRVPQDRVNVGVWKGTDGKKTNSSTGTDSAGQYFGTCHGNGTSNPVLAYQRRQSSTSGFIETAQMK